MGRYPRQDFIYGFCSEDPEDEDVYDFCKENKLSYSCGYDCVAIGLEPDWTKIIDEAYLGGYYAKEFDIDKFYEWHQQAKSFMTEETIRNKIREFLHIDNNTQPTLWTISNYD